MAGAGWTTIGDAFNGMAERECVAYDKQQNGSIDQLAASQHEPPI
jgi:hypothetical protein